MDREKVVILRRPKDAGDDVIGLPTESESFKQKVKQNPSIINISKTKREKKFTPTLETIQECKKPKQKTTKSKKKKKGSKLSEATTAAAECSMDETDLANAELGIKPQKTVVQQEAASIKKETRQQKRFRLQKEKIIAEIKNGNRSKISDALEKRIITEEESEAAEKVYIMNFLKNKGSLDKENKKVVKNYIDLGIITTEEVNEFRRNFILNKHISICDKKCESSSLYINAGIVTQEEFDNALTKYQAKQVFTEAEISKSP